MAVDNLTIKIEQLRLDMEDKREKLRGLVEEREVILAGQRAEEQLAAMTEPEKAALIRAIGIDSTNKMGEASAS
jgi:hypothetical protein